MSSARVAAVVFALLIVAGASSADLLQAVQSGDVGAVAASLAGGADPNATAEDGPPALYFAALRGHADVVEVLLEAGADET
jgi:ankyrin repeat protein